MKSSCQQQEEEEEEAEEEEEEEEVSASVLRTCFRNYVATQVKNVLKLILSKYFTLNRLKITLALARSQVDASLLSYMNSKDFTNSQVKTNHF